MNFIGTNSGYLRKSKIFFVQSSGDNKTTVFFNSNFQDYTIIDRPIEYVLEILEEGNK